MKFVWLLCIPAIVHAQQAGDFRSHASGKWNSAATWEQWNGDAWVTPAPAYPNSASAVVAIMHGDSVEVTSSVQAGSLQVLEGVLLLTGGSPQLHDVTVSSLGVILGDGDLDLGGVVTNNGTINHTGTLTWTDSASLIGTGSNTFFTVRQDSGAYADLQSPFVCTDAMSVGGTIRTGAFTCLDNLTISGGDLTATRPFGVRGQLRVTAPGSLTIGVGADATLNGNISSSGTINSLATVVIADTTTLTGSGSKVFRDLRIEGLFTPNGTYSITDSLVLSGNGLLRQGTSTATMAGNVRVINRGSGSVTFNNITIAANAVPYSLTIPGDVTILGATQRWNGIFNCPAVVTFGRPGTTRLTGTGVAHFNAIVIGSGTTFTPSIPWFVTGDITVSGTITAGTGTLIVDGNTEVKSLGASSITFNNMVVNAGKTFTAPSGTMGVNGNLTNNGVFNANHGVIQFGGSTAKVISGTSAVAFHDVTVNNGTAATDLSLSGRATISGTLRLATNAHFDADGPGIGQLTLVSSADSPTEDASVAALPTGAQVLGNVTVQRYMSIEGSQGRIYRFISSPVSGATVADLQREIPVTGSFAGQSICPGCHANPSLFWYDESAGGGVNGGYTPFPVSDSSEVFVKGRGYAVFVRGNIDPVLSAGSARFDLTGPIQSGQVDFPVTYTSTGVPYQDGWNLIGNPYPSAIDWDAAAWSRSNIAGTIYMLDNGSNPVRYATWNGVVGTNGGSGIIASGQGFFIQAIGPSPAVTATENVKVPGVQTTFFRQKSPTHVMHIQLRQDSAVDEAVIHFRDQATDGFDPEMDAFKLKNTRAADGQPMVNLATIDNAAGQLAINSLPPVNGSAMVALDVSDLSTGSCTLSFPDASSFPAESIIVLSDEFSSTPRFTNIRKQSSYSFTVTSDPRSCGSGRFKLWFFEKTQVVTEVNDRPWAAFPNPVTNFLFIGPVPNGLTAHVEVYDMTGQRIDVNLDFENGSIRADMRQLPSGIYSVILRVNGDLTLIKVLKSP